MIIKYTDVHSYFKVGDVVYACAYTCSNDKDSRALHQKPVKGVFTFANTEVKNNLALSEGKTSIKYFVPFKKNGVDLAWSKAVRMSSRKYASTEQECIQLYNSLITEAINWHLSEIEELRKELIQ